MTEAERLAQALEHFCTDWDGSKMADHSEPMPGLHCIELRQAATELRRLSADAHRYRWLRNKADGESHIDHTMDQSGGGTYVELWVPFQPADPFNIDFGAELDAAIDQAMKDTP